MGNRRTDADVIDVVIDAVRERVGDLPWTDVRLCLYPVLDPVTYFSGCESTGNAALPKISYEYGVQQSPSLKRAPVTLNQHQSGTEASSGRVR